MIPALISAALACNLPGATTLPETQPPPEPLEIPTGESTSSGPAAELDTAVPATDVSIEPLGVFTLAVIVDTSSELVTRLQAQSVVDDASAILQEHTGFAFTMVDFVEMTPSGQVSTLGSNYIASRNAADLPNGIIIFSFGDGDLARTHGGYFITLPGPTGYINEFVSPTFGSDQAYVAINHFSHRYAGCGYGSSTAETPVQNTSFNGECRNQDGVACVEHNGYSMCASAVDNLYASTPTYFAASTIVHEFLHPFGPSGVDDHYYTPGCNQAMAEEASLRPYSETFSLEEAEYYNGLCPYVYDNFVFGYSP